MNSLQYGLAPKMKPVSPKRPALVAALDIGTSKIVCLIARLTPHGPQETLRRRSHSIEILGLGHVEARGMKAGPCRQYSAKSKRRSAARSISPSAQPPCSSSPLVSLSPPDGSASETFNASVEVTGSKVTDGDIARVLAAGSRHSARDGRVVMHSLPIGFTVDEARGVREPRGMLARQFGVDMHVATCDLATPRNLMLAVEQCHLTVEAMVASPYTAGLAVLADDEADLGAAVVDIGAGTTTIAVFSGGRFSPCRRLRPRRSARHAGSCAGAGCPNHRCRANQNVLWHCVGRWKR